MSRTKSLGRGICSLRCLMHSGVSWGAFVCTQSLPERSVLSPLLGACSCLTCSLVNLELCMCTVDLLFFFHRVWKPEI